MHRNIGFEFSINVYKKFNKQNLNISIILFIYKILLFRSNMFRRGAKKLTPNCFVHNSEPVSYVLSDVGEDLVLVELEGICELVIEHILSLVQEPLIG